MPVLREYQGRLAIDFGLTVNWEKPQEERVLSVAPPRIRVKDWEHLLGCSVTFEGNVGKTWVPGADRPTWIPTEDWERVVIAKPIRKPRRGKYHDWEWRHGRWNKIPRT